MRAVQLYQIKGTINDLSPLFELRKLESLYLYSVHPIPDINFLAHLPGLKWLGISGLNGITDFSPITGHNSLRGLWLYGCPGLTDINALRSLNELEWLTLRGARLGSGGLEHIIDTFPRLKFLQIRECDWLTDLSPLVRLPLEALILARTPNVADLDPIRSLGQLKRLVLTDMPITHISAISELERLWYLVVSNCPDITDLSPIAALSRLRQLVLYGAADGIDLSCLRRRHNLSIQLREGQRVTGTENLHKRTRIEWQQNDWEP